MVMHYANTFKDEQIDELNYENRELKDIIDSLQDELKECEKDFFFVQGKIPKLRKEIIHYNEHGHISDYSAVELMKIIEQMEY